MKLREHREKAEYLYSPARQSNNVQVLIVENFRNKSLKIYGDGNVPGAYILNEGRRQEKGILN